MFKRIALATLLFIAAPIAAANAQGFLLGVGAGLLLGSGGSNQHGSSATVLYTADEETLKAANPLAVRQVASQTCFAKDYKYNAAHRSLGELFVDLTKERGEKERVILQIARVFYPETPQCAAIWFAYTEK